MQALWMIRESGLYIQDFTKRGALGIGSMHMTPSKEMSGT